MSAKKKLTLGYCPIGNGDSIAPFNEVFPLWQDISKGIEGVDAVVFWGGTDIHPSIYKQPAHPANQVKHSPMPSNRDVFELKAMRWCITNDIPMIGVCRGAQLMCAFAGGSLIQDVSGHHGTHQMQTIDDELIETTSCHHQMMYLKKVDHELLAWSAKPRSAVYEDGFGALLREDVVDMKEPEVVYFPTVNGLAIQGHPEWAIGTRFAEYCNQLIEQKLFTSNVVTA